MNVGSPLLTTLGGYQGFQTVWVSAFGSTVTGIVVMVVHNGMGQTVEYSTGVLQLSAGSSGKAYLIPFGLPTGDYSATFFVITNAGIAISSATTASFFL